MLHLNSMFYEKIILANNIWYCITVCSNLLCNLLGEIYRGI
jgi:NADH:ubiquinone oxidoreductase subunit E